MTARLTVQERIATRQDLPRFSPPPPPPPPPRWTPPVSPWEPPQRLPEAPRSSEHYNAQPGVILGAVGLGLSWLFVSGWLFVPALVMGIRGRRVLRNGGTAPGANWSFGLGLATPIVFVLLLAGAFALGVSDGVSEGAAFDEGGTRADLAVPAPDSLEAYNLDIASYHCTLMEDLPFGTYEQMGFLAFVSGWVGDSPALAGPAEDFVDAEVHLDERDQIANDRFIAAIDADCAGR